MIMEKTIYLTSAYLAPVEYYAKLFAADKAYIERYDNYVKQTYRNRCVMKRARPEADGTGIRTICHRRSVQKRVR